MAIETANPAQCLALCYKKLQLGTKVRMPYSQDNDQTSIMLESQEGCGHAKIGRQGGDARAETLFPAGGLKGCTPFVAQSTTGAR